MSVIRTKSHSTQQFTYLPSSRTFSAEASDFGPSEYTGRIYDDAADESFWLVSHKTGREKPFVLWRTHSRDGDLTHWEFREINPRSGRTVEGGLRVFVFND